MAEATTVPDGTPVTTTEPAPQQPAPVEPVPDGAGNQDLIPRTEAQQAFAARDAAKAAAKAAAAQADDLQKQLEVLQAMPQPTQEDLDMLAQIKRDQAEAERTKALKEGDADAIAEAARKPLKEQVSNQAQVIAQRDAQLTTLLRDQALESAVRASQLNPIDVDVVVDALRHRITMTQTGDGQFVPAFTGSDGRPLYTADAKVTDASTFVDVYLKAHPGLCKSPAQPGSGAPAPGAGSGSPATGARLPQTIEEWNLMTPAQQEAATEVMPVGHMSKIAFVKKDEQKMFG